MTIGKTKLCIGWALGGLMACSGGSGSTGDAGDAGDAGDSDGAVTAAEPEFECKRVVSEKDCDESLRPIVFIHGTFGAADNIAHVAKLFGSNGYCQDRFVAIDYNSAGLGANPAGQVDELIDEVLERTGFDKVDLLGHSQGAGHGYTYASDPERAKRIAHYVHLAGSSEPEPPHPDVRTMSLSSKADAALGPSEITGADKIKVFEDLDHMSVASSTKSFVEMYEFLVGETPQYKEIQCGEEMVTLAGVVESFGDNVPQEGVTIEFYEMGDEPFERGKPVASQKAGPGGVLKPVKLRRGIAYESLARAADGSVIGHQYFGANKRSDYLVRALVPSKGLLTGAVTNAIVESPGHSVVIARTARGAFRADLGDSLTIDGEEVLLEELADAESTTVAYFMFDADEDGQSGLSEIGSYSIFPFVSGVDVFMDSTEPRYMKVKYNGTTLKVPAWPSDTEGPTVVQFQ